ncbi:hypothetical protein DDM87_02445 [Vibrio cholerae]|nr:hypothetical protein [Vibrio cholerae]
MSHHFQKKLLFRLKKIFIMNYHCGGDYFQITFFQSVMANKIWLQEPFCSSSQESKTFLEKKNEARREKEFFEYRRVKAIFKRPNCRFHTTCNRQPTR